MSFWRCTGGGRRGAIWDNIQPTHCYSNLPMARRSSSSLVRLVLRHPRLWLPILLLGAGAYGYEVWVARPAMSYLGVPQTAIFSPQNWTHILRNEGFLVGYSELRGNPLWVTYRVAPFDSSTPSPPRPDRFERDWRNLTGVEHNDYRGSGYDRGHLAPNYLIAKLYGRSAQLETFRMTNITPQRPKLNQKLWQRLEEIEAGRFAGRFPELWVVTGPIFDAKQETLKGSSRVEVPDAFFKVFAAPGDTPRYLALLVPQEVKGNEDLSRFVVSVDEVEAQSGLDLFPDLADALEAPLEAAVDPGPWGLDELGHRPSRY